MGNSVPLNITIVGAQNTGKSTIVAQYTGRNYLNDRTHTKEMQPMITIHTVNYNDKYYELCIRDTCGSKVCDLRSYSLCNNADAIIITFNINNSSTFNRAKSWFKQLHNKYKNTESQIQPIILLIATTMHSDIILTQNILHSEAQQFSVENNLYYSTVCLLLKQEIQTNIFTAIIDAFIAPKVNKDINKLHKVPSKHVLRNIGNIGNTGNTGHTPIIDCNDDDMKQDTVKLVRSDVLHSDPTALKIKIILLGDFGVGKTTLRRRLETNVFDPNVNAIVGKDCSVFMTVKKHHKSQCEVSLLDPSGQERFKNIPRQFYRGIHGIILMIDVTNDQSCDNIKFWMNQVEKYCNNDDIFMVLLCNKMDLFLKNKLLSQKIINNAQKYSRNLNIKMYNTSSKDNQHTKYINKAFEELVSNIIYDNELYKRLEIEQGYKPLHRFTEYDASRSFIHVDGRPYDIDKRNVKRTCGCKQ